MIHGLFLIELIQFPLLKKITRYRFQYDLTQLIIARDIAEAENNYTLAKEIQISLTYLENNRSKYWM